MGAMDTTIPIMSKLFRGISPDEGRVLMDSLGAYTRSYRKGETLIREGQVKRNIGVLLDGCLEMFETDEEGRRSMVGVVRPPESFALVFAFANVQCHPAAVTAREDSRVLVIPLERILPRPGAELGLVHRRFIKNLMGEICETSWGLRSRAFILSRRSTAERLMTYLRECMHAAGKPEFDISYDRQGLADFLCVDRSALSSVISRLAKRGLLSYRKNHFVLLGRQDKMEDR